MERARPAARDETHIVDSVCVCVCVREGETKHTGGNYYCVDAVVQRFRKPTNSVCSEPCCTSGTVEFMSSCN